MILQEKGYVCDRMSRGDILLIGNGAYGYRGTLEENTKENCVALNANGFYDKCGNNWRETVNMPNPLFCVVKVDGVGLSEENVVFHTESLNLKNGTFCRQTEFVVGQKRATIFSERFFDQRRNDLLLSRFKLECSAPADLEVTEGIDCDVWNVSGNHFRVARTCKNPLTVFCTTNEGEELSVSVSEKASTEVCEYVEFDGKSCNRYKTFGTQFCLDKFCFLSRNGLQSVISRCDYDQAKEANERWWEDKWKVSRVTIEDEHNLQLAMDYSVYQLIIYAPKAEGMSVAARGLSGQTYKGAVFWDTEMFMLPFYLETDVETAKRLVRYRVNTLDGARQKAAEYGFEGAFFPWESQNGQEACSDFNVTDVFTGRPVRTYFRDKQIHVSADIAVALFNAYSKTKDLSLLTEGGAELLVECALFYVSYAYFNVRKNRFELLDVIGPDEYHERVNNNAYTNYLAFECADVCLKAISLLTHQRADVAQRLTEKYANELKRIRRFKKLLYLPQPNEHGVIEQFDGYFKLEDVCVQQVRERLVHPNEYWGGSGGVATATRVIKQADVVALMCVLPHRFSKQVKKANYFYYLPYTEHGSSLSASGYSRCACYVDRSDDAYGWFEKSATTDLTGGGKKFAGKVYIGGTHPAACGGAWLTAFEGFAHDKKGNSLPSQIKSLTLNTQKGSFSVQNPRFNEQKHVTTKKED